jgi:hypothetical protein
VPWQAFGIYLNEIEVDGVKTEFGMFGHTLLPVFVLRIHVKKYWLLFFSILWFVIKLFVISAIVNEVRTM